MSDGLGNLPDNQMVSLAVHGCDPFMPENGAFCGGYQGLLYPNPTTLIYPGFDPYKYLEPEATVYTPDIDYTGLGIGNPGIDYKNPGHILGLLDTFSRMSYGIGMLQAIHAGNDSTGSPAVNIRIPLLDWEEYKSIDMSDIYPSLCSLPTDWINNIRVLSNGKLYPSNPVGAHTPTINPIDEEQFNRLFADKLVLSYYGMPQYLRAVIEKFAIAAKDLERKVRLSFELNDPGAYNNYGHIPVGSDWRFPAISTLDHHELVHNGKVMHQCKILSPSGALKVLTGSDAYHNGANDMNEYRSLTELNSVINLIPLRTVGATYLLDDHSYTFTTTQEGGAVYRIDDWTPRAFRVASHMYSDLVINISDVPKDPDDPIPGKVTITGEVRIKNIIPDVSLYNWHQTIRYGTMPLRDDDWQNDAPLTEHIWGPEEWLHKFINVTISKTNKHSWDRTWLGGSQSSGQEEFEDDYDDLTTGGGIGGDLPGLTPFPSDHELVVPFSKSFTLTPGCNTILLKIIARNRHLLLQEASYMIRPDQWVPYGMYWWQWWAVILGYPPWVYIYPRGTLYTGWENNPDSVPGEIEWGNIQASFVITGTNFDPIKCEVSL